MKTIIAGTRTATQSDVLAAVKHSGWLANITEVVSGGNKVVWPDGSITGADYWGEQIANGMKLPVKVFRADWKAYGNSAGPRRNQQMVDYAEALILAWDGLSRGSADVLRRAAGKKLQIFVYRFAGL